MKVTNFPSRKIIYPAASPDASQEMVWPESEGLAGLFIAEKRASGSNISSEFCSEKRNFVLK